MEHVLYFCTKKNNRHCVMKSASSLCSVVACRTVNLATELLLVAVKKKLVPAWTAQLALTQY